MSSMSLMPAGPREWIVDDLDGLPDDGLQYELLDGLLLVTPAPAMLHQHVAKRLYDALNAACGPELLVYFAPLDWRPDARTSLQPDLLVIRAGDYDRRRLTDHLELVVEILSPSTRRKDTVLKRSKYQDCRLPNYWIVDPQAPSIEALALVDGLYRSIGRATGAERVDLVAPFPVTLVPADLTADPVLADRRADRQASRQGSGQAVASPSARARRPPAPGPAGGRGRQP